MSASRIRDGSRAHFRAASALSLTFSTAPLWRMPLSWVALLTAFLLALVVVPASARPAQQLEGVDVKTAWCLDPNSSVLWAISKMTIAPSSTAQINRLQFRNQSGTLLSTADHLAMFGQPLTSANSPFWWSFTIQGTTALREAVPGLGAERVTVELEGPAGSLGSIASRPVRYVQVEIQPTGPIPRRFGNCPGLEPGLGGEGVVLDVGNFTQANITLNVLAPDTTVVRSVVIPAGEFIDTEIVSLQLGIHRVEALDPNAALLGRALAFILGAPLADLVGQTIDHPTYSIQTGQGGSVLLHQSMTAPGATGEAFEHIGPNSNVRSNGGSVPVTSSTVATGRWQIFTGSGSSVPQSPQTTTTVQSVGNPGPAVLFPTGIPGIEGQLWNPDPTKGWRLFTGSGERNVASGNYTVAVRWLDNSGNELVADPKYRVAIDRTVTPNAFVAEAVEGTLTVIEGQSGTQVLVPGPGDGQNLARLVITADGQIGQVTLSPIGGSWPQEILTAFTVQTPAIALNPTSGPVGTQVTVTGSNFAANEPSIGIFFDGVLAATGTTAAADGSWTANFTVPSVANGPHAVDAAGSVTPASAVADQTFTVITPMATPVPTPIPTPVPSLSQWGLVGMAGLFAVVMLVGMRLQARAWRKVR
ncbi:MAG: IPT/TIG domain-containing protein [Chloroflexi bacterium]|nr:IPT/TIG domain-containing protein [Chloroflexota bacterium]